MHDRLEAISPGNNMLYIDFHLSSSCCLLRCCSVVYALRRNDVFLCVFLRQIRLVSLAKEQSCGWLTWAKRYPGSIQALYLLAALYLDGFCFAYRVQKTRHLLRMRGSLIRRFVLRESLGLGSVRRTWLIACVFDPAIGFILVNFV
jgi:hypothetical protein